MTDPLQAIPSMSAQAAEPFPATSRYHGIARRTLDLADGRKAVYVARRFIPPPDDFDLLQEHTVTEGERLDHLAAQYLGDPERFWQICDANAAMRPEELTEAVGARIRITLPSGIPGASQSRA